MLQSYVTMELDDIDPSAAFVYQPKPPVDPVNCIYHDIFGNVSSTIPLGVNTPSEVTTLPVVCGHSNTLYQPLAPFQIRVLHIEPGGFEEPLKASLSIVDLLLEGGVVDPITRQHCTYEAISYCWGAESIGGFMNCNGQSVALRDSQYTLLKHVRDSSTRHTLWLDTLCINQNDVAERSVQVRKMFLIFQHAERVLIWLGLPKSRTMRVFDTVTRMDSTLSSLRQSNENGQLPSSYNHQPWVPDMPCTTCLPDFRLGISEIYSFPWFRRTWVRQEVFASSTRLVLCGALQISWQIFVFHLKKFILEMSGLMDQYTTSISAFARQLTLLSRSAAEFPLSLTDGPTGSLDLFRKLRKGATPSGSFKSGDLFNVLADSCAFDASDPRDIIYGVLGMSNAPATDDGTGRSFLRIDYGMDASYVFCEATRYFIRREKNLDAMFLAQINRDPLGRVPSWCPYWPSLDVGSSKLMKHFKVKLQKSGPFLQPIFGGEKWPKVPNAQTFETDHSAQFDEFVSFAGVELQVQGLVLGAIRVRMKDDGIACMSLDHDVHFGIKPRAKVTRTWQNISQNCDEYTTLQVKHADHILDKFRRYQWLEADLSRDLTWLTEECDRSCVASVPTTTQQDDWLCYLKSSSTFVILRPLEVQKHMCRAQFVGVAFASEGVFRISSRSRDQKSPTNSRIQERYSLSREIETIPNISDDESVENEESTDDFYARRAMIFAPSLSQRDPGPHEGQRTDILKRFLTSSSDSDDGLVGERSSQKSPRKKLALYPKMIFHIV